MGASPISAMMLPMLIKKITEGGGVNPPGSQTPSGVGGPGPGGGGGGGGMNPEAIGAAVSSEYSQLQNIDPGKILADLQKHKEAISAIFPVAVNRVADAAKGISQAVTGLNSAIKAFEKASEGLNQTRPSLGLAQAQQQPMTSSVAPPPPPPMGGGGGGA